MSSELLLDRLKNYVSLDSEINWYKNNIRKKKDNEIISLYIDTISAYRNFEEPGVWNFLANVSAIQPFPHDDKITEIIAYFFDNMRDKVDHCDYLYIVLSFSYVFSFTYQKVDSVNMINYFIVNYSHDGCLNVIKKILSECDDVGETINELLERSNAYSIPDLILESGYGEDYFHLFLQSRSHKKRFILCHKLTYEFYNRISQYISDEELVALTGRGWIFSQTINDVDEKIISFINHFVNPSQIIDQCLNHLKNPFDLHDFIHLIDGINNTFQFIRIDEDDGKIDVLLSLNINYNISSSDEDIIKVFINRGLIDRLRLFGSDICFFSDQLIETILLNSHARDIDFMILLYRCDFSEKKLFDPVTKLMKIIAETGKKIKIYNGDVFMKMHMMSLSQIFNDENILSSSPKHIVTYRKKNEDMVSSFASGVVIEYDEAYMIESVFFQGRKVTLSERRCIFRDSVNPSEYETLIELQKNNIYSSMLNI